MPFKAGKNLTVASANPHPIFLEDTENILAESILP